MTNESETKTNEQNKIICKTRTRRLAFTFNILAFTKGIPVLIKFTLLYTNNKYSFEITKRKNYRCIMYCDNTNSGAIYVFVLFTGGWSWWNKWGRLPTAQAMEAHPALCSSIVRRFLSRNVFQNMLKCIIFEKKLQKLPKTKKK